MKKDMFQGAKIISTGSSIPCAKVSNEQLSSIVETSDEWIFTRTGIKERRLLTQYGQSIVELASEASIKAIEQIQMDPKTIDLLILATSSPDDLFGSASKIQHAIGATNAISFDLTAACSGFVVGLVTAFQFIRNGSYKNILVIGADVLSKWVDWSDRSTCILFGDAAGAIMLQACDANFNSILNFHLKTDGRYANYLSIAYKENIDPHPILKLYQGSFQSITMNGKEVYKFAVSQVPLSILTCLHEANLSIEDVDWLLLHQANERILMAVADKLSISSDKIISNLGQYGNTSAASIPLALNEAVQVNRILAGDIVVIAGFGAGLTWGSVVLRW